MKTEKKSAHTPGPWLLHDIHNGKWVVDSDKENEHVCLVYGQEHDAETNARLIAAAPDLLEAVKEAIRRCSYCQGEPNGTCGSCQQFVAAIAKAEGK